MLRGEEHLAKIQTVRNPDHFVDEVSQRRVIAESVVAVVQAKNLAWCAGPYGCRPMRCEMAALPSIAILGFFCICGLLEMPHERQQSIGGDIHRRAFNVVEMIDTAKNLDVGGNSRANDICTILARHGRVGLTGPWTRADDHLAPEKSDEVPEFGGSSMKIAGAKSRSDSVIVAVEGIECIAQLEELRH